MSEANEILLQASTLDEIKTALEMGADVDALDRRGRTKLFSAETAEITNFLIYEAHANIFVTDKFGNTALTTAKTEEQTKLLLDAGLKLGINRALLRAATAGQTRLLLDNGADPYYSENEFSAADVAKSEEQLQLLRDNGAVIKINENKLEAWERRFSDGHISGIPEEAMELLGRTLINSIESVMQNGDKIIDNDRLVGITHALCHIYENGDMAYKSCRIAGDLILDKLIEKAEQGFMSYANRSIDGYWQSIKDNPEAWKDLKAVLEKHPNYEFGQKYLGYMNGEEPEDSETLREKYLHDPSMLFVTTMLMDIDGTLIQDGRINDLLIEKFEDYENYHGKKKSTDDKTMSRIAVYTGGNPESQKQVLLKAAAERILELSPSLQGVYTIDAIIEMYSKNDQQNMTLREDLVQKIEGDQKRAYKAKLEAAQSDEEKQQIEWNEARLLGDKIKFGKKLLIFIKRLESKEEDKIEIYPKQAFMRDNICLAGIVIDDTQPQAQEMKSLSMAVLNPGESSLFPKAHRFIGGEKLDVPEERKITAEQVFEMYTKEKLTRIRLSDGFSR